MPLPVTSDYFRYYKLSMWPDPCGPYIPVLARVGEADGSARAGSGAERQYTMPELHSSDSTAHAHTHTHTHTPPPQAQLLCYTVCNRFGRAAAFYSKNSCEWTTVFIIGPCPCMCVSADFSRQLNSTKSCTFHGWKARAFFIIPNIFFHRLRLVLAI